MYGPEEYLSLDPLQTRIRTHQRCSEQPDDVEQAALDALQLQDVQSLLDIGCGTGSFLRRLAGDGHRGRLIGVDSSRAAVAALAAVDGVRTVLADASALPFRSEEFGAVTARHMLYHVRDVRAALRESRRVLRTDGRLIAIVNHADATPRVDELVRDSVRHVVGAVVAVGRPAVHSDNLPGLVEEVFGNVVVRRYDNALVFIDHVPLARYAVAVLTFHGIGPEHPSRGAVAAEIERRARAALRTTGVWRDPKGYAVCIAAASG